MRTVVHGAVHGAVLCAGRAYCDLVFSGLPRLPSLGTELFAGALSLHGGGGAYISAAWLAALGREAELCAMLPAAPFGAIVAEEARANGVALGVSVPATDGEPQVTVAMVAAGERAFLTRRPGAALPPDHLARLVRPGLVHLHVSELATLIECPDLARRAHEAGLSVSLDCGWDDAVFARDDLAAHLAHVDVFLPNEIEHEALRSRGLLGPDGAVAAVPLTVVKRGAAGARAIGAHGSREADGVPAEAIDTTGAGDAFCAGFLHGWLDGLPIERCLALGNDCGALAVARRGGASELASSAVPGRERRSDGEGAGVVAPSVR